MKGKDNYESNYKNTRCKKGLYIKEMGNRDKLKLRCSPIIYEESFSAYQPIYISDIAEEIARDIEYENNIYNLNKFKKPCYYKLYSILEEKSSKKYCSKNGD